MARSFNGASDYINTGNFTIQADPLTVGCWTNLNGNVVSSTYTMICARNGAANGGIQFRINASNLEMVNSNLAIFAATSTITLSASGWNFAGAVYPSGGNISFYYGNPSAGVQTQTVTNTNHLSSPITHGYDIGGATASLADTPTVQFWPGFLADLVIWNTTLTAAEMTALANGARPYAIRPSAIVSWWPLTGVQSPEPDFSTFANNGTLVGTDNASGPPVMQLTSRWPQRAAEAGPPTTIILPGQFSTSFAQRVSAVGY